MEATSSFVSMLVKAALTVSPVTIDTSATYQFNPSISQEEGCKRAEDKAKVQALRKVFGQDFGADSTMSCRETDQKRCDHIQNIYENTRGYIQSVERRVEKVKDWSCTVDLTVRVKEPKKREFPILFQAQMDRVVYTQSDNVKMTVISPTEGMVTVFKYDPVTDVATKVFPMPGVKGNLWTYPLTPLTVTVPASSFPERDAPYYMLVTVSSGPIKTVTNYRLHEYYEMMDNVPYQDVNIVRKSFYVSRSKM
jgi:hypothetical protein